MIGNGKSGNLTRFEAPHDTLDTATGTLRGTICAFPIQEKPFQMQKEVQEKPVCAVVAAVQLPSVSDVEFEASLTELRELAKTLGFKVVRTFVQKRAGFDAMAYVGVGKREEIRRYVANEAEADPALYDATDDGVYAQADPDADPIDVILVDHEISPSQARNLEKAVGCEVMDRTMVILEIFHRNARSRAARAQVEIARLGYMAPRMREAAKLAGPQGRQRSGLGGRGAGESATEMDRRKIRDRIAELQLEIAAMDVERKTQRARRQERQGLAGVALVGCLFPCAQAQTGQDKESSLRH